jgi:hypothetical protein
MNFVNDHAHQNLIPAFKLITSTPTNPLKRKGIAGLLQTISVKHQYVKHIKHLGPPTTPHPTHTHMMGRYETQPGAPYLALTIKHTIEISNNNHTPTQTPTTTAGTRTGATSQPYSIPSYRSKPHHCDLNHNLRLLHPNGLRRDTHANHAPKAQILLLFVPVAATR